MSTQVDVETFLREAVENLGPIPEGIHFVLVVLSEGGYSTASSMPADGVRLALTLAAGGPFTLKSVLPGDRGIA